MRFKNKREYKTASGGVAAILSIISLASGAALLSKRLFLHELPQIQSSYLREDLRTFGNVSAEDVAFDFALELRDRNMAPVHFDKTYFSLETFHEVGWNDASGEI